ncbi:MAG: AhpC/TSA family protein [Kiritimatiellaceae bacterium]|nr:AhpC/TSA family protein [Kiritimatiellaceae bacterium]
MIKKTILMFYATAAVVSAEIKPLMIGQPVPAGAAVTVEAKAFDLQSAASEQRLAIIYYRGGWCPFCTTQLKQLNHLYDELMLLGFRIIALSPDKPSKLRESLDGSELSFTLLSDSTMKTAQAFGIAYEVDKPSLKKLKAYNIDIEEASGETHHLLPVPSVFLVGTDGRIDFVYANPDYTTRLDPEVLLAAARSVVKNDQK